MKLTVRRKTMGVAAVVAALGVGGVAIANGGDPEIDGTTAELEYSQTSKETKSCKNSTENDRLVIQRWDGTSQSSDPELDGKLKLWTTTLYDQDDDRISVGTIYIQGADDPKVKTFAGYLGVDVAGEENEFPPDDAEPPVMDQDSVQGFTLGKSTTSRRLLGNLTLGLPEDGSASEGTIGDERAAGDDAVLKSGFCDTNGDGKDDFRDSDFG